MHYPKKIDSNNLIENIKEEKQNQYENKYNETKNYTTNCAESLRTQLISNSKYCERKMPLNTVCDKTKTIGVQSLQKKPIELKNNSNKSFQLNNYNHQKNDSILSTDFNYHQKAKIIDTNNMCLNKNINNVPLNLNDKQNYLMYNNNHFKIKKKFQNSADNSTQMNTSMSLLQFNPNVYSETNLVVPDQHALKFGGSTDYLYKTKNQVTDLSQSKIENNTLSAFCRRQSWRKNKSKKPASSISFELSQQNNMQLTSTSPASLTNNNVTTNMSNLHHQQQLQFCTPQTKEFQFKNIKNNSKQMDSLFNNSISPMTKSFSGGLIQSRNKSVSNNNSNDNSFDKNISFSNNQSTSSINNTINYYSNQIEQQQQKVYHNLSKIFNENQNFQNEKQPQQKSALIRLNSAESHFQQQNIKCLPKFNYFMPQRYLESENKQKKQKQNWINNRIQQHQLNFQTKFINCSNKYQPCKYYSNLPTIKSIHKTKLKKLNTNFLNLQNSISLPQSTPLITNNNTNQFNFLENKCTSSMYSLRSLLPSTPSLLDNSYSSQKFGIKKVNSFSAIESCTHLDNVVLPLRETYIGRQKNLKQQEQQYMNLKQDLIKPLINQIEYKKRLFQKRHIYPQNFESKYCADKNKNDEIKKEVLKLNIELKKNYLLDNTQQQKNHQLKAKNFFELNDPQRQQNTLLTTSYLDTIINKNCIKNSIFGAYNTNNPIPSVFYNNKLLSQINNKRNKNNFEQYSQHTSSEITAQQNLNNEQQPVWELQQPVNNFHTNFMIEKPFDNANISNIVKSKYLARKNQLVHSNSMIGA